MPFVIDLTVRYHQQNDPRFCAPTTAMMIFDSLQGGLTQEEHWWPEVKSGQGNWNTDPMSFEKGLNEVGPAVSRVFVATRSSNEPDGTRTIVEALCSPNAAPVAALVRGKSHWLVVNGVNLTAQPRSGVMPAVLGFYINSPSPTALRPPEDHTNADRCGKDFSFGSTEVNQYVTYAAWKHDWFNGYVEGGKTLFATVCAKKRVPLAMPPGPGALLRIEGPVAASEVRKKMVSPAEAKAAALNGIAEHGLAKDGPLREALVSVTAGDPELVHRLDADGLYYYLIPLVRGRDVVALARTDAVLGDFMGACAVGEGPYHVSTAAEIAREMPGFRLVDTVWMPCVESMSPYNPFQRLAGPRGELYVDRNGNRYCSLTPPYGG